MIHFSHFQHIMKDSSDKPVATDTRVKSRPSVRPTSILEFRQEQNVSGFYILGRSIEGKKKTLATFSGVSIFSSLHLFLGRWSKF